VATAAGVEAAAAAAAAAAASAAAAAAVEVAVVGPLITCSAGLGTIVALPVALPVVAAALITGGAATAYLCLPALLAPSP